MDNSIDLKSHNKCDENNKTPPQQSAANHELDSTCSEVPELLLSNNLSKNNSKDDKCFTDKVFSVSNVYYDLICEGVGDCQDNHDLKTNETNDYHENDQENRNQKLDNQEKLTRIDNISSLSDQQLNSIENGTVDVGMKNTFSMDVKAHNCVENSSSEAGVMVNSKPSRPERDEIQSERLLASIPNIEELRDTVQNSLLGKPFKINPRPNEFDLIQDKMSPHYNTILLNKNNDTHLVTLESDKSVVISNNNAIPQAESIVTNNFSLGLLKSYDSDESSDGEACEASLQYRENKSKEEDSDTDSSSSSSSSSIIISDSSDSESDELYENFTPKLPNPIKARKELDLDDLPAIEDLKISVPEEECIPMGKVFQIVERLVVIQAFKDVPAYNLDTVLFVEGGQPLGQIFDVFGPVTEPYYCVRFNSNDHVKEKNICIDQMVYSAPKTKYTNYVFLAQLMKLKGSDASWEDDDEPPEIYLEYSDDEQEQRAKKKKPKNRNRKAVFRVDPDPDEPERKRHFTYEKRMNERNLQLTAVRNNQNGSRSRTKEFNNLWSPAVPPPGSSPSNTVRTCHRDVWQPMFGRPPMFGGRVPPHNVQFPVPPRTGAPRPDQSNFMRTPPPCFSNPNTSNFSQPPPEHRSDNSNNYPAWNPNIPSFPRSENPWRNSRFENTWENTSRDGPVINNNPLPSSPFWNQRPPPSPNVSTPNNSFLAVCPPPPQLFWPTQSPPQSRNAPYNNVPPPPIINFNPNLPPPPSPNHFNR